VGNADVFRSTLQTRIAPAFKGAGAQTSAVGWTGRNSIHWLTVPPPAEAVIAAVSAVLMVPALAVNVALVAPDGTRMTAGTDKTVPVAESATVAPPAGAGPEIETVQEVLPLTTNVVGEQKRPVSRRSAARIVIVAILVVPPAAAVIVAVPAVVPVAFAVKVALAAPSATVAEAGTVRAALLLESVTICPPAAATLLSVSVQVDAAPAASVAGLQETDAGVTGAASDSDALAVLPFSVAVS
jgi:hypothetical protein